VLRYSAILLCIVTPTSAGPLSAQQVIKPGSITTTTTTYRLPKPASVTASQQPDGKIRVVWRAVVDAASYKLVRSVPPEAAKAVTLPNPSDTQYVDSDVKAGSTYYYLVSAVNADGIEGLKAGTSLLATAVAAPAETTVTQAPVPPATNAVVKMYDYLRPEVTWQTSVPGARGVIDRGELLNGTSESETTWTCSTTCRFVDGPRPLKVSALTRYRVTIVEPAPSTRRSEPVITNNVLDEVIPTAPTEIHQVWLVKGESHQLRYRPDMTGVQYVSLDSNTVSIWSPGVIKAKEFGVTYVTATGLLPDGSLKMWLWKTWVGSGQQ
jgi:hypothetical protein